MLKLFLAVVTLQVLISLSLASLIRKRETITEEGGYVTICRQAPIELGIVLDASSSISRPDFKTAITFLQQFLGRFDIGNGDEGVRVAVITYGKGIYPEDGFNFDTYQTKEEVIAAVGAIPHRAGPYTDTGKAIEYMHNVQLAPDQVRPYAEKTVVVLTDGNSQNWRLTKKAAEDIRDDGVAVFAVGVGSGVRDEELINIAGNSSMVTKVDSYDKLSTIQEILASKTCIKKERPTTTPPPKIQTCGEVNPTDVNFVFSSASLGHEGTAWATSFISSTISTENLDVGFQYGVISGTCPDDAGFDLDTYTRYEEYKERLDSYDVRTVSKLVERLVDDGFSEERGGRPDVRRVAVIVATEGDREDLAKYVRELTDSGVEVYIADPTGNAVTVDGATTLNGQSSRSVALALTNELCPSGSPSRRYY